MHIHYVTAEKYIIAMLKVMACSLVLLCGPTNGYGQRLLKGTVYDKTGFHPISEVRVAVSDGHLVLTDSLGRYSIQVETQDSIRFSYKDKSTIPFAVADMDIRQPFDMRLQLSVSTLPTVYVTPRIYRLDSLQNRRDYQKIFDFERNDLGTPSAGAGIGIMMDALFNAKKEKRAEAFQKRLIQDEEYDYVSHRFTKALVKKISGLEPPALDTFMHDYRPAYRLLRSFETEYEYYQFLQSSVQSFSNWWTQKYPGIPLRHP
jgi:hypothetical protein